MENAIRALCPTQWELIPCGRYEFIDSPRQSGLSQIIVGSGSFPLNIDTTALLYQKTPDNSSSHYHPRNVGRISQAAKSGAPPIPQIISGTLPITPIGTDIQTRQVFHMPGDRKTEPPKTSSHTSIKVPSRTNVRFSNRRPSLPHKQSTTATSEPLFFNPNIQLPNPKPRLAKRRKPRKRRKESLWASQYRYLTKHTLPIHNFHRNDPHFHLLFLIRSSNPLYAYRVPPTRLRFQNRREAFIRAQLNREARARHLAREMLAKRKRNRQRLFKVAYLTFKRERFRMLTSFGLLGRAYEFGWTAHREWVARKGLLRSKVLGTRRVWRKRKRGGLVLDKIQSRAERRIFEVPGLIPMRRLEHLK